MITPTHLFQHTMTLTPYISVVTAGNTVTTAGTVVTGVACRLQLLDKEKQFTDEGMIINYDALIFCGPSVTVTSGYTATINSRIYEVKGVIEQGSQPNVFQKKLLVTERRI